MDWWAWEPETHGEYSVKSVHRKLAADHMQPQGPGDASWKRIWSPNVPSKVRVFWWRALHEFLPALKEVLPTP